MVDPIIYGSGLIARGFSTVQFQEPVIVFASGVSNSRETNPDQFLREARLVQTGLKQAQDQNRLFIYFSTCSVENVEPTPYILHKREMEHAVSTSAASHLVCRLPQVVGLVQNATLFSFLSAQLWKGQPVTVQANAVRNLIDINDVTRMVRKAVDALFIGTTVVIGAQHSIVVLDLVRLIAGVYRSPSRVTVVPGGDRVTVDLARIAAILPEADPLRSSQYPFDLCRRYAALFAELFQAQYSSSRIPG